ncbi:hypothetical protein [Salipiger sp. IMCC34102]|uniref:hypothetical protein n=1 Tax=Salipiger sp. IMCC34102 TaxID=2510647 RepID=UPI001F5CBEB5|nr:hypothetical protein [Salipiger sp. IMCC34102]
MLRILLPLLVWLASFSAIYGLHGIGCAAGWPDVALAGSSLFRLALLAAWIAAIVLQVAILIALRSTRFRADEGFAYRVSVALAWVGVVAILWTLFPLATVAECRVMG